MPDVAIITASYGFYDSVKRALHQEDIDAEWVLVTDSQEQYAEAEFLKNNPAFEYGTEKWRVVYEPRDDMAPFRAAKRPKFRPWEYTDAPASIWIDGSVSVRSPGFAANMLSFANPIAEFDHDYRDCIYEEATESLPLVKYAGEPIEAQAAHYRAMGHPENWGLWFTTIVVRQHTDQVKEMSLLWESETTKWSTQDQVSHPYVLRNAGLRPRNIKPNFYPHTSFAVEFSDKHRKANQPVKEEV